MQLKKIFRKRIGNEQIAFHFHSGRGLLIDVFQDLMFTPGLLYILDVVEKK